MFVKDPINHKVQNQNVSNHLLVHTIIQILVYFLRGDVFPPLSHSILSSPSPRNKAHTKIDALPLKHLCEVLHFLQLYYIFTHYGMARGYDGL